jgi:hypothetical protein
MNNLPNNSAAISNALQAWNNAFEKVTRANLELLSNATETLNKINKAMCEAAAVGMKISEEAAKEATKAASGAAGSSGSGDSSRK